MHPLDWAVVLGFTAWIVYDGLKRTKDSHEIEGYFLAKRIIPWWAAGISVMATQLSAITMIGTTGQGYTDGLRFIQFYFALPLAMVILSVTLVPFFYNSGVYTAYEYLERRFDAKTRSLTSLLFLMSRGMSCGAVDLGAGGRAVAGARLEPDGHGAGDRDAGRGLHDVRRRAGRDVDRREDHGPHRLRAVRGHRHGASSACPPASGSATASSVAAATGRLRTLRLLVRPHQPVHVLVGNDRRAVPVLLVLRHRSEPGAALPDGAVGRRGAALAADERVLEDSAAGRSCCSLGVLVFVFYVFTPPPLLFSSAARRAAARRRPRRRRTRRSRRSSQTAFDARRAAATELVAARHAGDAASRAMPAKPRVRQARGGAQRGARPRRRARPRERRRSQRSPT